MSLVVLGRFRIEKAIGGGVTGSVYRARVVDTEAAVAVKEVRRDLGWIPVIGSRSKLAVQAARDLKHPSLGGLHAIAEEEDRSLIVTDWVDGEGLDEVTEWSEGRLPIPKAVTLMVQVLEALQAAHQVGLIHGDLKPENLLIPRGGGVKRACVVDFGVAPVLADTGVGRMGDGLVPNLGYRAPEQLRDPAALAPSVDIYAVGALCYHVLTGRSPFASDDPGAVISGHLREQPKPIRDRNPQVPDALAAAVIKALAKDPGQRFTSAAQMREAIAPFAPAAPAGTERPGRVRTGRPPAGAVAAAVGGAVATAAARRAQAPTVMNQAPAKEPVDKYAPTSEVSIEDVIARASAPAHRAAAAPGAAQVGPAATGGSPPPPRQRPATPSRPAAPAARPAAPYPPPRAAGAPPRRPSAGRTGEYVLDDEPGGNGSGRPAAPPVRSAPPPGPEPELVAVSPLGGSALADEPPAPAAAPVRPTSSAAAPPPASRSDLARAQAMPETEPRARPKSSGSGGKLWLILIVVGLVLAIAAAAVYLLFFKNKGGGGTAGAGSEPAAATKTADEPAAESEGDEPETGDEPAAAAEEKAGEPEEGAAAKAAAAEDEGVPAAAAADGAAAPAADAVAAPPAADAAAAPSAAADATATAPAPDGAGTTGTAGNPDAGAPPAAALGAGGFPRAPARDVTPEDRQKAEELNTKGFQAYKEGHNSVALEAYVQALATDPNPPRYWYNAACLHAVRGDVAAAITYLEGWAARMEPGEAAQMRQKIDADADFDTVRTHPRFEAFRSRLQ